jgi:iron complex outermembrane receptor protein
MAEHLNLSIFRNFNWQILLACLSLIVTVPVGARELQSIEHRSKIESATSVAQSTSNIVKVTAVKVNPTATGIEVILTTPTGNITAPAPQVRGNLLYFDLPNASLALTDSPEFRVEAPAPGITNVVVTQVNETYIRVLVRGTNSVPTATLTLTDGTSTPIAETPNTAEIEINVTGLRNQRGYKLPNSTTATKTDTPLKDIPQAITIIPPQVLQDRGINKVGEALENVSSVTKRDATGSVFGDLFTIRGFLIQSGITSNIFRDGVPYQIPGTLNTNDLDRVEVLKGPASVLFGAGQPGGVVNLVSKKPLPNPDAKAEVSIGSFNNYRGSIDLSGPIDPEQKILYRVNADYETSGSFRNFVNSKNFSISPVVTAAVGDNTQVSVYAQIRNEEKTADEGIPVIGRTIPNVPRDRFFGEEFGKIDTTTFNIGYTVEHKFSENWSARHNSNYLFFDFNRYYPLLDSIDETTGEISRTAYASQGKYHRFSTSADVIGKVATGNIQHTLLFGTEFRYGAENPAFQFSNAYDPINLFNPVYIRRPYDRQFEFFRDDNFSTFAVYFQDQVALSPALKVIAGARFDTARQFRTTQDAGADRQDFTQTDSALSPRVGIVYQPVEPLSLYASYTRSFAPSFGASRNLDDASFAPETGGQLEVGLKADLSKQLSLNLAAYDIKKQNVQTPDPNNPDFTLQTGEQTSRGIELDLTGKILPGLNVTAAYAYTDAFVSRDNIFPVGNRLSEVPYHQASLLTTYELPQGSLKGVGVSLGLYYVGSRQGDLSNSYELPSYLRTDASLFYKQDNWRAQLNFRNLFNQGYFISNFGDRFVSPGAPFNITASLGVEF